MNGFLVFRKLKEDAVKELKEESGVYCIGYYVNGRPKKIGRLLRDDKSGVIYFGKAVNIRSRLTDFLRGMQKGQGHSAGNRFYYLYSNFKNDLGHNLWFSVKYAKKNQIENQEGKLLISYIKKFGELPPLNNKEPNFYYTNKFI